MSKSHKNKKNCKFQKRRGNGSSRICKTKTLRKQNCKKTCHFKKNCFKSKDWSNKETGNRSMPLALKCLESLADVPLSSW